MLIDEQKGGWCAKKKAFPEEQIGFCSFGNEVKKWRFTQKMQLKTGKCSVE